MLLFYNPDIILYMSITYIAQCNYHPHSSHNYSDNFTLILTIKALLIASEIKLSLVLDKSNLLMPNYYSKWQAFGAIPFFWEWFD